MFIKKSRFSLKKHPIEVAFDLLKSAVITIYGCKHNADYKPTEHDLKMLDVFVDEMYQNYLTVSYIAQCLHKRSRGEEEIIGKVKQE